MRKENDARLAIRVPKETAEFIKYQASKEGVSQKDYTLRAINFYNDFKYMAKEGYADPLAQMSAIRHRSEKIRQWCQKLGIDMADFYLDALNFYLDALVLSDGQPDTIHFYVQFLHSWILLRRRLIRKPILLLMDSVHLHELVQVHLT